MRLSFVEKLSEALRRGEPFAMVTLAEVVGSAPQEPGARLLLLPDGSLHGTVGGGALEHHLIEQARQSLADGRSRCLRIDLARDVGMVCGGSVTAFVEPFARASRAVIFGAGHVCRAVAPLLVTLGFGLTVVDDRPEWASAEGFPEGTEVIARPYLEVAQEMSRWPGAYVLVMTRGHSFDYELLRLLLPLELPYLGVMASRNKAAEFRRRLMEGGLDPATASHLRMPLGLAIGSQSPEEIAVSVAGELIQVRRELQRRR